MDKKYGIFSSSQDPQQLSLAVQSAAKVLIGILGAYAAFQGLDQTAVTNVLQQFIDIVATLIPVAYATFHSLELAWGLLRKLFALLTKKGNNASVTAAIVPPTE